MSYSVPTIRTDSILSLSGINLIPTDSDVVPVFCKELVLGVSLDDRTFSHPNISCKNIQTVLNLLNLIVFYVICFIFCRGVLVILIPQAEVFFRQRTGKLWNEGFYSASGLRLPSTLEFNPLVEKPNSEVFFVHFKSLGPCEYQILPVFLRP
jgi:hypothetical protein